MKHKDVHGSHDTLRARRQALARALLGGGVAASSELARITPRIDSGPAPLSFAQERLWFLDSWNPGSSAYNVPITVRLLGTLDIPALQGSLETIVMRHEVLRAYFPVRDGRPEQVIRPHTNLCHAVVDLSGLDETARERETRRLILDEISLPFNLATGPLIRVSFLRHGPEEHILVLVLHHIATDAWSKGLLARELSALYSAFTGGGANPLSPLPIQYPDFAAWQRNRLERGAFQRQIDYWRKELAGAPALLDLPADRPRAAVPGYEGARIVTTLDGGLCKGLIDVSRQCNLTLFMTLLASFYVLLYRYTGLEDIVVGTPIANRTRSELEPLIGFFMNTLALRVNMSGNPTFIEFLTRVRQVSLAAYSHQDLPFDKLVEELQPQRSTSHSPIFQVMFALQNADTDAEELPGLKIEPIDLDRSVARFDLALSLVQMPQGIEASLEFSTDLFDMARMERLLGHYGSLLEGILADPEQSIARLPLLTAQERNQLALWNHSGATYIDNSCLHELFEQQMRRTPNACALENGGESLTYAELDVRAERLAVLLQESGIGPEMPVALCGARSVSTLVGILAILKAGGVYLPVDSTYPADRIAFILRDTGTTLALVDASGAAALDGLGVRFVRLNEDVPPHTPGRRVFPGDHANAAYLIYTSGSTGRPKGVVISHGAYVNMVRWLMWEAPGSWRTLQYSSYGFDVSVQEIFGAWSSGGTLVLISEETRRDPDALLRLVEEKRIERLHVPVVMLQQLAMALPPGSPAPSTLRQVMVGGEQMQISAEVRAFFERTNGATLHNQYGPTETHGVSSCVMRDRPHDWPALPPIGKPVPHAQVWLLDRNLQQVPVGVPGELYAGGPGLARGYLNRSDLTAERFVPDAYSGAEGARLYRTGDQARFRPDGTIEFLGRIDGQVKIRGFRIEIGEVENVLMHHPAVSEAVVLAQEKPEGDKRLVAWVVASGGASSLPSLREHLRDKLPDYMAPSTFVFLDRLPVNANGKVDRKMLPAPAGDAFASGEEYEPPATPVEEELAKIWGRLLHVDRVGRDDDFFELGGHSLLATQVIARVRAHFKVELPLRALFENPTVSSLGHVLESSASAANGGASDRIVPVSRDRPLSLSFAQQRLWFMEQLQPGSSLLNFPMALRLQGNLDVGALKRALTIVQQRHEVLRTVFGTINGGPVQIIRDSEDVSVSINTVEALPEEREEEEVQRLISDEAARPFDLENGPVFRCHLIRLAPDDHVMVFTLHHIAADYASTIYLTDELSALYRQELTGQPASLPILPVQYADYAAWQHERFRSGAFQGEVDYWMRQLQNAPPFLDIPADYPRPSSPGFSRRSCRFALASDTVVRIGQTCHQEKATPFMFLLAAFQILLARATGRQDIIVGTDVLNRERPETKHLIGFFINQLVLRTSLAGCESFREVLRRTRDVAIEAYANQELPFDKLVEILRPARDPERPPLYQVKLAYTQGDAPSVDLEGLQASWVSADRGTAQLDMTLFLREWQGRIFGRLEYRDELFSSVRVSGLAKDYETMVSAFSQDPDLPLDASVTFSSSLSPITEARERKQASRARLLATTSKPQTSHGRNDRDRSIT